MDYSTQLPFTVTPGDSVVSTTGLEAIGGNEGTYLSCRCRDFDHCGRRVSIESIQAPYTRPIRQSVSSADDLIFSAGDINYALLRGLPAPATSPAPQDSARLVERIWLDHYPGEFLSSRIHPLNNMRDYGRDIAANVSEVAMQMMLDCNHNVCHRYCQIVSPLSVRIFLMPKVNVMVGFSLVFI